ncbi:MAG: DUF2726 domain-containing protein [Anaerolineae bacterium]|nr:DUF2726 domain-containing protein [Anaerolineae bacterium]
MANEKFSFIRGPLKLLGLSDEAIDKTIDFISDLLFEKDEKSSKIEYPYHQVDEFISAAELNFFFNLKSVVGDSAHIFSKLKLSDLFYAKTGEFGKNRTYTNKIDRKHVDFLLCDAKTLKPILGIEHDDKSHQRADRQERDDFVNHVFEAAKLPLIHVSVQRSYSQSELKSKLSAYLSDKQMSNEQSKPVEESSPRCPKCGSEMVIKIARQGERNGKKFWACPNFPNCEGTIINIDT